MPDVSFNILAGADDGYCGTNGVNFNPSFVCYIGRTSTRAYQSWLRFGNVTIPAAATISSAVIRFTAYATRSTTTLTNIYFEAADDPLAPTDWTDLDSRSLGSPITWDFSGYWYDGTTYDTSDLTSILQAVIDRGGWASGQAVQAHIIDDGSASGGYKDAASYDLGEGAQLVVSYSIPYGADASDSIEISESFSIESDLIREENISIQEDVEALLGFDESLPLISQEIEVSESVTMLRGLGVIPLQSEDFTIAESIELLLGFDESLPAQSETVNLSEYTEIALSFTVSVAETITINDYGAIYPAMSVSEAIGASEYALVRRGYWEDVDDSFLVSDTFDVFHYTDWLRQNRASAKQRFFFTLTGAANLTTDIEIPISSIYATKRSGDPTYLQVVIPTFNYAVEIATRSQGEMIVDMGYEVDGEIGLREQILVADLEDISQYEGPVNRSVVLSGHRTVVYSSNLATFQRNEATYRAYQVRARSFRFAFIDPFINPGDTVVVGGESFTCNNIIYIVNAFSSSMEVREAL